MEEQRQRQEEETRRAQQETIQEMPGQHSIPSSPSPHSLLLSPPPSLPPSLLLLSSPLPSLPLSPPSLTSYSLSLEGMSTGEGVLAQADMASLPYNPVSMLLQQYSTILTCIFTITS